MNLCDAKQKAFAQRVYFDLKMCRKWSKLHVYFYETNKWIFFVGRVSDDQPLTFVLPISSDEQMSVDDLFNLKSKLTSVLTDQINENIQSVLMAIIANDFTLAYFNFSLGLPTSQIPRSENLVNPIISNIDEEFRSEIKNDEWSTTDTNVIWD